MASRNLLGIGIALCALAGSSWAAGNVRIAERPLVGPYTTLQAAVDAALEGESLLVTPGTYASFTIDAKSVKVFVTGSGQATISGRVKVQNIASGQHVLLTRLKVSANNAQPALSITNVSGNVRVQDSNITGSASGIPTFGDGVFVDASLNVVFSGCSILGGSSTLSGGGDPPVEGGIGVRSTNSSIALYGCTVQGGTGSQETSPSGGQGGRGIVSTGFGFFASACTFRGGNGGGGDYVGCNTGGTGGTAIVVDSAQGRLLDDAVTPGGGGWSSCGPPGATGPPPVILNGGIIDYMAGSKRTISMQRIAPDDASVPITITGLPGDLVYLRAALRPSWLWKPGHLGVRLVPDPLFSNALPVGTIPPNGTLVVASTFPVPDGAGARTFWLQALCIDTTGQPVLTGPAHVLALDVASGPDCNGNGRLDTVDILFGNASDCDGNLTPDACETDCNGNGILDSCDIASHTSTDANGNGIPDECEAQYFTWYVDDSAAPGGNGSQAAPFLNLLSAVSASLTGDTIIVADGLYQGPGNRDIFFNGRNLTLRSVNGPGTCTIDCQGLGRAFRVSPYEKETIEGFAFVNGRSAFDRGGAIDAVTCELTLRNCTFANCFAWSEGGAVSGVQCTLTIQGCQFTGNTSEHYTVYGYGGALYSVGKPLRVRDCLFAGNSAGIGGAIYISTQSPSAVFTHCTFIGNHSNTDGGAGLTKYAPAAQHVFDDCLFAGNSAAVSGGALATDSGLQITSSTFVSNTAVDSGGAIQFRSSSSGAIHDTIAVLNTAATGRQLCVGSTSGNSVPVSVTYSDIQGGQSGVAVFLGVLTWGAGNVDLDPMFSDPDGPDNDPLTLGDNDYTLGAGSPCIDAGNNFELIPDLLDVDGDGDTTETMPLDLRHLPRRADVLTVPDTGAGTAPVVDMGAYERQG